jgi:hypothetical protein
MFEILLKLSEAFQATLKPGRINPVALSTAEIQAKPFG